MSINGKTKELGAIADAYRKMKAEKPSLTESVGIAFGKKSAIEEAYKTMLTEDTDTGGDGSSYNKTVLAATGDLPKDKEDYLSAGKKVEASLQEGMGSRDEYALHRQSGDNYTHAIVHKFSNDVHKPFRSREDAINHLYAAGLNSDHRVVSIDSLNREKPLKESTTEDGSLDDHYEAWKKDTAAAHPEKNLKFRWRIQNGLHHVSAEVPGEDRCYGMWDHDADRGHVFHEEKIAPETKKLDEEAQGTTFRLNGRVFNTHKFGTPDEANAFMSSEAGANHGYLGQDDEGMHHCAHMEDEGKSA